MEKNKKLFILFPILLLRLIKETLHILNQKKKKKNIFFLSITQFPVRTYMKTQQQEPRRKGQVSNHVTVKPYVILKKSDQKQTSTKQTKGKTR